MKPALVVLAAGMGSRYGGLKQLDRVGPSGETIIDYSVFDALRAGFEKIVFIIRPDIEDDFRAFFQDKLQGKAEVLYVHQTIDRVPAGVEITGERKKPWGTGHAVLVAKEVLQEPFAVINADDFYGYNAYTMVYDTLAGEKREGAYCMVGYQLGNTLSEHGHVSRGICAVNEQQKLQQVVETTRIEKQDGRIVSLQADGSIQQHDPQAVVSMNFWGFTPDFTSYLDREFRSFIAENGTDPKAEFYIPSVVAALIRQQKAGVHVHTSAERWFGVTYREDKPVVEEKLREMVEEGKYPASLW